MKYKQHFTTSSNDWDKNRINAEHNLNVLEGIDNEQEQRGELLWRHFKRNVADGHAYYQIVKVSKKNATVKLCRGICLDEWTDNLLGEECTIPLCLVESLIGQKDALNKLFGRFKK